MNRATVLKRFSMSLLCVVIGIGLLICSPAARADGAITIDLSTVSADGTGYTYDGVNQIVSITGSGEYIVTGDGIWNTVAVAPDIQGTVNLTLQSVNIQLRAEGKCGNPLTIGSRSSVNLNLVGDNLLLSSGANGSSSSGILLQSGSTLTIFGPGSLDAEGWGTGSGIGPVTKTDPTGTVIVTGGTITARGGQQNSANCSGSGMRGNVEIDGGTVNAYGGYATGTSGAGLAGAVTINGGTITAAGGYSYNGYGGAGIGGAGSESGGVITINGGDVTATGGDYGGAGIGGGYCQPGGTIVITGGSVKADGKGGDFPGGGTHVGGAGIGGGGNGGAGGTITISGSATVVARGDNGGAGIGGGSGGAGGSVTILGGQVNARGDQNNGGYGGAGIGGGYGCNGGQVTISGGTVAAQGGLEGAGIGGATNGSGGQITISGGQVTATGGDDGSGIGSGRNGYHHSNGGVTGGTIQITGGTVVATGVSGGAGIGAGYNAAGGSITIGGGTVTATGGTDGGAGIGGGSNQDNYSGNGCGGTIAISGGTVTALGQGGAAGIGGGRMGNAGSITISGGRVSAAVTNDGYVPGIGAGSMCYGNTNRTTNTLTISGGRVYAAGNGVSDIGGQDYIQYLTSNTFTGGSIRGSIPYNTHPTNGSQNEYETAVTVHKAHSSDKLADTAVTYFLNGSETGIDSATDESGNLYLWLPQGAATVLVKSGGDSYSASGTIAGNNSNAMTAVQQTYEVSDQDGTPLKGQTLTIVYEGYGSGAQQTADITVKNYGTMPLQNFSVTVNDAANAFNFIPPSATSLAPGDTADFKIWAKDSLVGGVYEATVTISADNMKAVTLKITQTVKLFTVSFYNQSPDPYATVQAHYNMGAGKDWPEDPKITGYDFTGWYNIADVQVTADTPITSDLYLESGWTLHSYTITYDLGGGSVEGNPESYTIKDDGITLTNPTKAGYSFAGWSLNGSSVKLLTITIPKGSTTDWTIKANWTANSYTVVYDGNGADSGSMAADSYTYGVSAPLTKNTYKLTGYSFAGWALSKDGAAAYDDEAVVKNLSPVNGDTVTLYAQWTKVKYLISYTLAGGTVASPNPDFYYVDTPSFTLNNPTRSGYAFAGWSGTGVTGASANVTVSKGLTGNRDYTAHWTANGYTVAYNGNGADGGSMAAGQFTYGVSASLAKNSFTRIGYSFAGWALSADGTVTYQDSSAVLNLSAVNGDTVTLYAQWTKVKYQISYTLAGGTVASPNPDFYYVDTPSFTLSNPARLGYTFAGWSGTGITGLSTAVTVSKGLTGNRDYTANWKINVTFVSNGGTAVPTRPVTGGSLLAAPPAPTKAGHKFVGWYKNPTLSTPWNFVSDHVTQPTTLYARWLSAAAPSVKPASTGFDSVKLTWNAVSGADKYEVWRAEAQTGPYVRLDTVTATAFKEDGLTAGKTYYYKVLAMSQCLSSVQQGAPSVVSVRPIPTAPGSVKAIRINGSSIRVTWAAVVGASGYEVSRATTSPGVFSPKKDTTATAYTNTGLTAGRYYFYKIRAYRIVNGVKVYGDYSVVVSAKP